LSTRYLPMHSADQLLGQQLSSNLWQCPTFNLTPACKRDCCLGENSAPRGKHVYCRIASNRAGTNKRVKGRNTCQDRGRERERSVVGWIEAWNSQVSRHITIRGGFIFIDPSRCHCWLSEFLHFATLSRQ